MPCARPGQSSRRTPSPHRPHARSPLPSPQTRSSHRAGQPSPAACGEEFQCKSLGVSLDEEQGAGNGGWCTHNRATSAAKVPRPHLDSSHRPCSSLQGLRSVGNSLEDHFTGQG